MMRRIVLVFVCLLCLLLLTDCSPVRKRRRRPKNASVEISHGMSSPMLNRSSKIIASVDVDHQQDSKMSHDVVQVAQVNFAGKRVAADPVNDVGNEVVAGTGPVLGLPSPQQQSGTEGERVGQLMAVLAIPGSSQVNASSEAQKANAVKNGEGGEHAREEQGVAVGVGGMHRDVSTVAQGQKVYHKGPDSSLDIGAADRRGSPESHPKALSQNEATNNDPPTDTGRSSDNLHVNPALQQPPPQVREPPLDQFRDQQIQLGPVKPYSEPSASVPNVQQPAPLGRNEAQPIGIKEPKAAAEAYDEPQPNEHPLKFKQQQKDVAVEMQTLKLDINPPDHMEGVRMEQDGHLNHDYKKEIFLGHHEEFEWSDEEKVAGRLKVIFRRVDTNRDNYIDGKEIQVWIMKNVKVHLDDAIQDNAKVFRHLDADKDGYVSWLEFFSHFLVAKGYVHSAKDVPKDESAITLETDDKERILRYKYRWNDADEKPKDEKLDVNEMMNFRHPEQSKLMIERLVKDLVDNVDRNGDGIITDAEFVALPHELDGHNPLPMEEEWQEERRKEFQNVIDLNKDGKVDDKELKVYFDPHNVNHAKLEAENLIRMADSDNDGRLSVEEVLDNTELFIGSKMVDAKRKLHDEF